MRKGLLLMFKSKQLLLTLFILLLLTSCSSSDRSGNQTANYDQTKKMVVDILKTEEGKKAIQNVMKDEKMQKSLVLDQKLVQNTIQNTLTSEKGNQFLKTSFQDPKFATAMAKSMKTENEKLLKGLMKDPEYRGMVIETLKDPELQKDVLTLLKSKEYRQHVQKIMTETFESPLYKAKIEGILMKAAEEMKTGKTAKDKGGEKSK